MKKYLALGILLALMVPAVVLAQANWMQGMETFQNVTGLGNVPLPVAIARIVKIILSFLGLIAVVIIIIGGFQWMTSGGNEEKIGGAKKLMGAGIVGLAIVVLAYAITTFIVSALYQVGGTA